MRAPERSRPPARRVLAICLAAVATLTLLLAVDGRAGADVPAVGPPGPEAAEHGVVVRYYYGRGCPYCALQAEELDRWEAAYDVRVHRAEVWHDADNRAEYQRLAAAYGEHPTGVPATFIGERLWIGFDATIAAAMRAQVERCARDGCDDPLDRLASPDAAPGVADEAFDRGVADGRRLSVPLVGVVDADAMGLVPATALIAFVDGFNPCSLWVLSVLLAMLLRTGSRRRIAIVGGAFLATTAAVYGFFIAGVFGAMSYVGYLDGIRWAVAALALAFAAVNIKDHVAFKRGFSFTIPDRYKPRIYRGGRRLLDPQRSLPAVTGAAVLMALGIALVELPCTAGFPVVWSGMLADAGVSGAGFGGLLSLYLGIYLLDELALFAAVVVTLRIARFQERHGQVLKLVGGMVMLALGLVMLLRPSLMHGLGGTVAVFAGAAVATLAVHLVTRRRRRPPVGSSATS